MSSKTIQISARITHEDAEFISQLSIEGARTPSDKLRAIITDAKRRNEETKDYRSCFHMIQNLLIRVTRQIRPLEMETNAHSELLSRLAEWLPDTVAYFVSATGEINETDPEQALRELENGLADRVFRLIESVLQVGVTKRNPCYDPEAITKRMNPVADLVAVIDR